MQKIIIAAVAENGIIGRKGTMPWHIPQELQQFKLTTLGSPMIMGRKTFTSLPKMLPGRPHIILTRNSELLAKNAAAKERESCGRELSLHEDMPPEYVASWQEAFRCCEKYSPQTDKLFIIGGAKIFAEGIRYADALRLTTVHLEADGDCFFPITKEKIAREFIETSRRHYPPSAQQKTGFTVVAYRRARP